MLCRVPSFLAAIAIAVLSLPTPASAGRIIWPCSGSVTSTYGPRSSPCSGCSTYHHGIDIGVGSGTYLGSPGNGTVTSYAFDSCGGNVHKIGYGNGWETRFLHCSAQVRGAGTVVTRNVDVARSGNTGSCTTGAHLHFEVRRDGASQNIPGGVGAWVTRATEIPQEYPGLNDAPPAAAHKYIGVLHTDGTLNVKDGLYGGWVTQMGGVTAFDMNAGTRIGALAGGTLYCKEGFWGSWTTQLGGVAKFQLSGDRIAVLTTGGTLYCKDGLYGSWFNQLSGVTAFHINGNRIGVIAGTGNAYYVKEGLQGGWVTMSGGGVAKIQLHGERIAALYHNGILSVKEGLYGSWFDQMPGVSAFQLEGNRIAALAGGTLYVKEGLQGGWTNQLGGVTSFELSGNRIGVVTTDSSLYCKDGLYGSWFGQTGGVSQFHINGDMIGAVSAGSLLVKEGLQGGWTNQIGNIGSFKLNTW